MTVLSDPFSHDTTDDSALPATTDPNVAVARQPPMSMRAGMVVDF